MGRENAHQTVLLTEAIHALSVKANGIYVDCTYGRGGHSEEILLGLGEAGRLLAFDRDPMAVRNAQATLQHDERFQIFQENFNELGVVVEQQGLSGQINGVLMDLGVSSPQLDEADRGFSFQTPGPIDMRMDTTRGLTAAEWLGCAKEEEIANVIWQYGEERYSRRIARAIKAALQQGGVTNTVQLAEVVSAAIPRWEKNKHPATRTFQAIRIYINDELASIKAALQQAVDVLCLGGRLVVISFHSLEDRLVKNFIRSWERPVSPVRGLPPPDTHWKQRLKSLGKAVRPKDDEIKRNPRARSAVMRVAERVA